MSTGVLRGDSGFRQPIRPEASSTHAKPKDKEYLAVPSQHFLSIINNTNTMGAFSKLASTIARQYEKAGMSPARAEAIGGGVAYKQGVKKLGGGAKGKKALLAKARAARMKNSMS